MDTVQGPGQRLVCSVGTALGRIPPGHQAGLLLPWPPGPGPGGLGPVLPITLSVKAFWEGVLTGRGTHPPPELHWPTSRCPQAAGQPFPRWTWCRIQRPLGPSAALRRPARAPARQWALSPIHVRSRVSPAGHRLTGHSCSGRRGPRPAGAGGCSCGIGPAARSCPSSTRWPGRAHDRSDPGAAGRCPGGGGALGTGASAGPGWGSTGRGWGC